MLLRVLVRHFVKKLCLAQPQRSLSIDQLFQEKLLTVLLINLRQSLALICLNPKEAKGFNKIYFLVIQNYRFCLYMSVGLRRYALKARFAGFTWLALVWANQARHCLAKQPSQICANLQLSRNRLRVAWPLNLYKACGLAGLR